MKRLFIILSLSLIAAVGCQQSTSSIIGYWECTQVIDNGEDVTKQYMDNAFNFDGDGYGHKFYWDGDYTEMKPFEYFISFETITINYKNGNKRVWDIIKHTHNRLWLQRRGDNVLLKHKRK